MRLLTTYNLQLTTSQKAFTLLNPATPTARKRYLTGFTLVELLVTMSIIVVMALVAIPNFNKHQQLTELQSKSDEVKVGLDEMHVRAINPEKGVTWHWALIDVVANKIMFGYAKDGNNISYKEINLTSDQVLAYSSDASTNKWYYLVCETGKNFCCGSELNTSISCPIGSAMNNTAAGTYHFNITNSNISKTTTFKIYANPFRITATTP